MSCQFGEKAQREVPEEGGRERVVLVYEDFAYQQQRPEREIGTQRLVKKPVLQDLEKPARSLTLLLVSKSSLVGVQSELRRNMFVLGTMGLVEGDVFITKSLVTFVVNTVIMWHDQNILQTAVSFQWTINRRSFITSSKQDSVKGR